MVGGGGGGDVPFGLGLQVGVLAGEGGVLLFLWGVL